MNNSAGAEARVPRPNPRLSRAGGNPHLFDTVTVSVASSFPRRRESTSLRYRHRQRRLVFPAQAGIHISSIPSPSASPRLSRAGGNPHLFDTVTVSVASSFPRKRESTSLRYRHRQRRLSRAGVFPASAFALNFPRDKAGIHISSIPSPSASPRLSRAGGNPHLFDTVTVSVASSFPRRRESTSLRYRHRQRRLVFPAQAGIHISSIPSPSASPRLSRAGGNPHNIIPRPNRTR